SRRIVNASPDAGPPPGVYVDAPVRIRPMNRPATRYLLIGLVTAGVSLAAAFHAKRRMEAADTVPAPAPPPAFRSSWTYKTEQEWIVAEVVRALADMA